MLSRFECEADSYSKRVSVALSHLQLLNPSRSFKSRVHRRNVGSVARKDVAENEKSHRQAIGLVPDFSASEFAPGSCRNANGCWKFCVG
jgi:hypothetical protein